MNDEIEIIMAALRSGNFRISTHAQKRMDQRHVSKSDIQAVGDNFDDWREQKNGTYLIEGRDIDGDDLDVVCG